MLRRWKRMGVPPETLRPISCVECHTPCQPGWTHCRTCGSLFLLDRVKGRFLPGGFITKLIAIWVAAVVLLIGIPLAATLNIGLAITSILALLLLAAGFIYLTFRPVRGSAA